MYRKYHDPRVREFTSLSKVTFLLVVIIFATWLIASGLQPSPMEVHERQQKASTHACIVRNLSDESDSPTMWTVRAGCDAGPDYHLKESPTVSSITRYQSPPASQTVSFLDGNGALLKRFAEETACSGLHAIQSADLVSIDADWIIGRNHGQVQVWHREEYASGTIKQVCNIIQGRQSVEWKTVAK